MIILTVSVLVLIFSFTGVARKAPTPNKLLVVLGIALLCIGSIADGTVEGYEFDSRLSFERKFGVEPTSFWGSDSWEKAYINTNVWNKYMGVADFYHEADDTRKIGYIMGAMLLVLFFYREGKSLKRYSYLFLVALAVTGGLKSAAMWWIRS